MKSDMETKDWLNEFTALKQVNPNNPFTVPVGYFSNLSERTLSVVNIYKYHSPTGGFSVPQGYFDELKIDVNSRINIAVAVNAEETGFAVPENYFDELAANISSRVMIEEALQQNNADAFAVPEGYFDNLQQQITARVAVEEALAEAQNAEAFAVPDGYFENLNKAILSKTVEAGQVEEPAPIATVQRQSVVRKLFASGIFRYAAAACVTVGIGVAFFLNSGSKNVANIQTANHAESYLHNKLSSIPISEIRSYVEQNLDAGETQSYLTEHKVSNSVTDDELLDYIDTEL